MRITVDIDDKTMHSIQQATGVAKKSPAVSKALRDYLRGAQKRRLIGKVMEGKTDYSTTNEDLESANVYDAH